MSVVANIFREADFSGARGNPEIATDISVLLKKI